MSGRAATDQIIRGDFAISVNDAGMPTPPGWQWLQLLKVAKLESGHTPSRKHPEYWEGEIPWIGIKDALAHNGAVIHDTRQHITELGLANSAARILPSGTVCLSRTASVGYVLRLARPMATSQDFVCWVCSDKLLAEYLSYLLLAEKDSLKRFGRGTTHTTIYFPEVKALRICMPSLVEQKRIVAALDAVLAKVASCQTRLARIPPLLKRFRQAVLAAACSGRLTADWREKNSNKAVEWKALPASEACEMVQSGSTPPRGEFESSGGIPFLKVYNIVDNRIDFEYRPQFVSEKVRSTKLRRSVVLPGDVLMNIVGPPLGKVAIVPNGHSEWNINQALVLFRPRPMLNNRFLYLTLVSGEPYAEILKETRGSAGQSNISLSQCRDMQLSIPGKREQQEIVRRVDALFAVADQLESRYEQARRHVDRLAQSVLAKAFRGELVPTEHALAAAEGRDYESATQLPERIRNIEPAPAPRRKYATRRSRGR